MTDPLSQSAIVIDQNDAVLAASENSPTPFFAVSTTKLFVMSICTLTFYQLYWFYKNWCLIKMRELSDIWPVPRAIFSILFCYSCFARIRDYKASGQPGFSAGAVATCWIVISMLHRLPDPYWLLSLLAPVCLIPVQGYVNRINRAENPDHDPNGKFSLWNWVAIAFGSLMLIGNVLALFFSVQ